MIITRYLARQIFAPTFGITGIIIFMVMSNFLRRLLSDAMAGQGASGELFLIVLYYIPSFLQESLPAGFVLGILIAYGRLYSESEMTALFACGFQYRQLLIATSVPAAILAAFLWVNNLYISPWAQQQAETARAEQASVSPFDLITTGRFMSIDDKVMYVEKKAQGKNGQELQKVFLVQGPDQIYQADSGEIRADKQTGARYMVLKDGIQQRGSPFDGNFSLTDFTTYGVKIAEQQQSPRTRTQGLSTSELFHSNGNTKQIAELMNRLLSPFNFFVAVFIAVPLSKMNPRQGRFLKVFPAVVIYALFNFLMNDWDKKVSKGIIPPELGIHVPQIAMIIIFILYMVIPGWLRRRKYE